MNKQTIKTKSLSYLKEIIETTKLSFEKPTVANNNMFERDIYKSGDGDSARPVRPGSEDHLKYKSKGLYQGDE
jgi:hypothetical protein